MTKRKGGKKRIERKKTPQMLLRTCKSVHLRINEFSILFLVPGNVSELSVVNQPRATDPVDRHPVLKKALPLMCVAEESSV